MKTLTVFFMSGFYTFGAFASGTISRTEYVKTYEVIAIEQMQEFKIPASIIMAQAVLESSCGNSPLAKKANNHFGIKCHTDWKGEKMYFDDDAKNECFRSYKSAEDSYMDHSLFLSGSVRYKALFALSITDYKNWAKGLKLAGYATNPTYAEDLIGIIEELKLNELDKLETTPFSLNYSPFSEHIKSNNDVFYVVAKKGDTYYRIAKTTGLTLSQLHAYNDFSKEKDFLKEGDIVYLEPKRNRSRTKEYIKLERPMSMREISQQEAVKLTKLMRKNQCSSPDEQLPKGEKVFLR